MEIENGGEDVTSHEKNYLKLVVKSPHFYILQKCHFVTQNYKNATVSWKWWPSHVDRL